MSARDVAHEVVETVRYLRMSDCWDVIEVVLLPHGLSQR
jgi:hypothetical protein